MFAPPHALRAIVPPLEQRARQAVLAGLAILLRTILVSRLMVHAMIVLHLFWLTRVLALPGDAFSMDPRQYAWFLARGSEMAWSLVVCVGAMIGFLGLCVPRRLARICGAACMGTVEFVMDHGLIAGHAAPTGAPTYGTLVIMCSWLIIVHWLPDRPPDFGP